MGFEHSIHIHTETQRTIGLPGDYVICHLSTESNCVQVLKASCGVAFPPCWTQKMFCYTVFISHSRLWEQWSVNIASRESCKQWDAHQCITWLHDFVCKHDCGEHY